MRSPIGIALAGVVVLAQAAGARAQAPYVAGAPYGYSYAAPAPYPAAGNGHARPYAFKDEPLMSINRSYLGYSNLVSPGPESALGSYSTYAGRRGPAYAPAPAPGRVRWFGARRGYRY